MRNSPDTTRSGVRQVLIDAESAGQRIDNFLSRLSQGVPKSHLYRLIRTGQVRVNGGRVKPTRKLAVGDTVRIPPLVTELRENVRVPDAVLARVAQALVLEHEDFLVLNKPAGLAVHGGSGLMFGVIDALRQVREEPRLDLVHRLDRDTSGLMLFSRHRVAQRTLQGLFRERQMKKTYRALVAGHWPEQLSRVEVPLLANAEQAGERRVIVDHIHGQPALTHFRCLEHFGHADQMPASLIEAQPHTGRTHQIRVHARHVAHALVGDRRYGDHSSNRELLARLGLRRLYLHAVGIEFQWQGETMRLVCEPDDAWNAALVSLREPIV